MREGFILELIHGHSESISRWTASSPEPSCWWGINMRRKKQQPIQSDRCTSRRYLESYATGD